MTQTEQYDVAICGAGPAGSTCALALGKSGLKVALIDKSSFPRDKVCGDALGAYIPKVLNTINPEYAEAMKQFTATERIRSLRIVAPNKKILDVTFKEEGYTCPRISFDAFLFDFAAQLPNVTVFSNTQIKEVSVNDNEVSLSGGQVTIKAKVVIGCDGAQSIINKKLTGTKIDLNHYAGAVRAYYKNVSGIPASTLEFHFLKDILPGYLWIFPLKNNTANVGLGILSKTISKNKINLREHFIKILDHPTLKERFQNAEMLGEVEGFGLPYGSRKVTVSGNRFMLCGDAASLIDPASGEGIGQAIISGRYAGWQVIKCFEKNNFSADFMKHYDKTLYDKLWSEHYRRYIFQRLIDGRPWFLNGVVNLAANNKFMQNILKKLVT